MFTNLTRTKIILLLTVLFNSGLVQAADPSESFTEYVHQGDPYPPVLFQSNIEGDTFTEKLKSYGAFKSVDKDAMGSPIGIIVMKGLRMKADATSFSSLMLSAGTLGLIPVVSNKSFKVQYGVFVQGDLLSTFDYEMTSTDVENMWSGPRTSEMKPAEELFLENSLSLFLNDLAKDRKAQELFREYYTYFDR
ncbi:hypothetical protein SAMN03080615_02282 [Amphritea atlantica]|jgi:hypothetical protein|uniref:Uncharacterized protein n=1 Tax=Amphritea atlantica TaxID=355243 RepID=A0A1H9HX80_9GAMM|nr:hypothetical protein [Amphritea atlantica]SEQ66944.1 hypothetical protein SAMN03080615_02282 [Amphritea atlantica]